MFLLFLIAMQRTEILSCREHDNHNIVFCKASTHQGDAATYNPSSVGLQCLPNCLIACTMTAVQKPATWTTDTMDYILQEGDNLYQHIHVGHDFPLTNRLTYMCSCLQQNIQCCERKRSIWNIYTESSKNKKYLISVMHIHSNY